MGISSDGMLFYGFEIDHEDAGSYVEDPDDTDSDWGDLIIEKMGATLPSGVYATGWLRDELGIEVHGHCSYEYYSPVFCIAGTLKRAWRGSPLDIDPAELSVQPDWDAKLAKVAEILGLDKGPPCWSCDGTGEEDGEPCTTCDGVGRIEADKPNTTPRWIIE